MVVPRKRNKEAGLVMPWLALLGSEGAVAPWVDTVLEHLGKTCRNGKLHREMTPDSKRRNIDGAPIGRGTRAWEMQMRTVVSVALTIVTW